MISKRLSVRARNHVAWRFERNIDMEVLPRGKLGVVCLMNGGNEK